MRVCEMVRSRDVNNKEIALCECTAYESKVVGEIACQKKYIKTNKNRKKCFEIYILYAIMINRLWTGVSICPSTIIKYLGGIFKWQTNGYICLKKATHQ